MILRSCVLLLISTSLLASAAFAEEKSGQEKESEQYHQFHVAGFLGGTYHDSRSGVTYGGDFEWRFHRFVGIGFTGEHINKPFRENVWIFPLLVHPVRGLRLNLGPGFERATEEEIVAGAEGTEVENRGVRKGLFRVGLTYDFELKHGWTIGPDVAVDIVDGKAVWVYGIAVGRGFSPRR